MSRETVGVKINARISSATYPNISTGSSPWGARPFWSAPYNLAPAAYRQGGGKIGIAANGDITACWRTNTDIRVADKTTDRYWSATRTLYTSHSVSLFVDDISLREKPNISNHGLYYCFLVKGDTVSRSKMDGA